MTREEERRYRNLMQHLPYHNVKEWLLKGAKHEDARTIGAAIQDIPEHRLVRRLARALARG